MSETNLAALLAERRKLAAAVAETPKYPCYAFNGNPVVESVCKRVQSQSEGERVYCVAKNCLSPWRLNFEEKPTITKGQIEVVVPEVEAELPTPEEDVQLLVVVEDPLLVSPKSVLPDEKLVALQEAAAQLRTTKACITRTELLKEAAGKLDIPFKTLGTYYDRSVSLDERKRLLYGDAGAKASRVDEKFILLLAVRTLLQAEGKPAPTKVGLAAAATASMKLTAGTIYNFILEDLTPEQLQQLACAPTPKKDHTRRRYLVALKQVRQEMRNKGQPAPGRKELAQAAAVVLKVRPITLESFISKLDADTRRELNLFERRSRLYALRLADPTLASEGIQGAIAVLRFKRRTITVSNLSVVLGISTAAIEAYLKDYPDIKSLLALVKSEPVLEAAQ